MTAEERTSTGDIKYPEDIWKAARPIAGDYQQAMAVAALLLAERQRCAALARAAEARQRGLHAAATEDRFRLVHGVGAEIVLSLAAAIEEGTKP